MNDSRSLKDDLTQKLKACSSGGEDAWNEVMPIIYGELKKLAASFLRSERDDHTLQPTALAHEAFIKLVQQRSVTWQEKAHFFAIAGNVIRRILVDYARKRNAGKARGIKEHKNIDDPMINIPDYPNLEVMELDLALKKLEKLDKQQELIITLRFFSGLSNVEIAKYLEINEETVVKQLRMAKAFLAKELRSSDV